ncbi:MAG: hypothetical protein ACLSIL_16785 [Enterococcus casseliflavus]
MRTKVTPQRLNQALLTGINWLPHLLPVFWHAACCRFTCCL